LTYLSMLSPRRRHLLGANCTVCNPRSDYVGLCRSSHACNERYTKCHSPCSSQIIQNNGYLKKQFAGSLNPKGIIWQGIASLVALLGQEGCDNSVGCFACDGCKGKVRPLRRLRSWVWTVGPSTAQVGCDYVCYYDQLGLFRSDLQSEGVWQSLWFRQTRVNTPSWYHLSFPDDAGYWSKCSVHIPGKPKRPAFSWFCISRFDFANHY
jgi:hypothetical protein